MKKTPLLVLVPIGIAIAFSSCKNTSTNLEQPPPTEYAQPVIQPLKLSVEKKINWDSIKTVSAKPITKKLFLKKIPSLSYDTSAFRPFSYSVEETKLDYSSLSQKDFDIDKLPSKELKFKTFILPPPKLIKAWPVILKNAGLLLYEIGEAAGFQREKEDITCLFTDRDGFLWIATQTGLDRYDGENIMVYKDQPTGKYIRRMTQDKQGRLWMCSDNELEVLDPKNGTLKIASKEQGWNFLSADLYKDDQQNIWVTAWPGDLYVIDPETQRVKLPVKALRLPKKTYISEVRQDKNQNIWIAGDKGIQILDLKNKKIRFLNGSNGLRSDKVSNLLRGRNSRMWICTDHQQLIVFDSETSKLQFINDSKINNIESLLQDIDGKIWVGEFFKGVQVIDPDRRLIKSVSNNKGFPLINIDNRGQVWFTESLNVKSNNEAITDHIGKNIVETLMEDDNGLMWESSLPGGGIDIIDRKTKTVKHISTVNGLSNDTIQHIKAIDGEIYICTNSGLDIIDTSKNTISHLGKKQGLESTKINDVAADHKGGLWIVGWGVADVYTPKDNTIKHLNKALAAQGADAVFLNDILTDSVGDIWMSGFDIKKINIKTGNIESVNNLPDDIVEFGSRLLKDNNGRIWKGTGKGLYVADIKKNTLTSFSKRQGLIDEAVMSLQQHNGLIYAGTSKGVTVIGPPDDNEDSQKKWKVESFGVSYGLSRSLNGPHNNDLITKDGLYWWGSAGITALDITKKDTYIPPVYITGMNIMDRPQYFISQSVFETDAKDTLWDQNKKTYYTKGTPAAKTGYAINSDLSWSNVTGPYNMPVNLVIPYNQNFIQLQYNNLNLAKHDTAWYRYKLIGADKDWNEVTNSTFTKNYINLSPGDYTFEVTCKNDDNIWGNPAVFSFTITPPWWQTWVAYISYVVLFAGIIWCFTYFRSLRLVKEKRVLEHKVRIRTEEVMQQKEEIESQRDSLESQRNNLENALSELKSAQTQLIQSEKMASLGELTAGIAHEIQNPLNFVNNFSEVNREMIDELKEELKSGNVDEALVIANDIQQNEEKISHHGKRADGIVKGMLEHSRSRSGQKEPTDINAMADEFMRLSYHGLRAKDKSFNAELIIHFDLNLPKIEIVQQDIGRVFLNLFNNAFYAVNQKSKVAGVAYKPEVTVTTSAGNGQVIIKVKDNGIGIPDAIKEKIMQPFFTTKPTGEGTGLGLSLTYDMVVKGHGGNITVESTEDEGSEFIVKLPLN